jgi:hypothetical protein
MERGEAGEEGGDSSVSAVRCKVDSFQPVLDLVTGRVIVTTSFLMAILDGGGPVDWAERGEGCLLPSRASSPLVLCRALEASFAASFAARRLS